LIGASRIVLRDWSLGKFPRFTTAPLTNLHECTTANNELADIYAKDECILSNLASRKDMRRSKGVVKFIPGEIESRTVVLDEPWETEEADASAADESESEDEGDDANENASDGIPSEDDGSVSDGTSDGGSEPSEMVPSTQPISRKRNRKMGQEVAAARPKKKVAFSDKISRITPKQSAKRQSLAQGSKNTSVVKKMVNVGKPSARVAKDKGEGEEYDFMQFF
jgi:nuclear GTP-binding protein